MSNSVRMKHKPKISKLKLVGVILLIAGLASMFVPILSPASMFIDNPDITAKAGEEIKIRYVYVNELDTQQVFTATLYDGEKVIAEETGILAPKTIYSGVMTIKGIHEPGVHTLTLQIGREQQQVRIVVK